MLTEQNGIQVDKFYPPTDWQYSFPDGYTRLEYLESTGTQYIDTGYVPINTTKWVLDAQFTRIPTAIENNEFNGRYDKVYARDGKLYIFDKVDGRYRIE